MKKIKLFAAIIACVMVFTACSSASDGKTWTVTNSFSYSDIAKWGAMKTPVEGSGSGSVVKTDTQSGFVEIKAAEDGWGGLESDYIEFDLDKEPMVFAKIYENPDGSSWGLKIIPENAIEDHSWALYLVPDNNMKWNKYAGVDLTSVLDADFKAIYGSKFKAKLWIYAAGGPEATVSVSEIKVLNTK